MSSSQPAPQQPPTSAAYAQPANPVERNPAELESAKTSSRNTNNDTSVTAHRTPPPPYSSCTTSGSGGVPSALGRGIHGVPNSADAKPSGSSDEQKQSEDVDADEQMAPPGEGDVADAVAGRGRGGAKTGAAGAGGGLSMQSDLERKKAEQAPLREAVKEERARGVDVGGVLGQTGGPASSTD